MTRTQFKQEMKALAQNFQAKIAEEVAGPRTYLSHDEALKVLVRYAKNVIVFREQRLSEYPEGIFVGAIVKGDFGKMDEFAKAIRALRRSPAKASEMAARERAAIITKHRAAKAKTQKA